MAKPAKTLQQKANEAADRIENNGRATIEAAHECGLILLEIKSTMQHGDFIPWIKSGAFSHSERQAQKYMQLAKYELRALLDANSISDALKIAKPESSKKPAAKPAAKPSVPSADIDSETPIQSPTDDGVEYEDYDPEPIEAEQLHTEHDYRYSESDDDVLPIRSANADIPEPEKAERNKVKQIVKLLDQIENRMYALKEIVATLDSQERQVLGFLLEAAA